jgi:hypothetical protein
MKSSTYRNRFVSTVVLGAVAAGIAASPVGARVVIEPGAGDVAAPVAVGAVNRPADVQGAAASSTSGDVMARHFRHEDALYSDRSSVSASLSTPTANSSSGFDWSDYAIGLGSGIGLIVFLAGGLVIGRQLRHRVQTA